MARIVDEASLACRQRVVARRRRPGSSFLGSPPAKRDSGETLAFPAAAGSASRRLRVNGSLAQPWWALALGVPQNPSLTEKLINDIVAFASQVRRHDASLQPVKRRAARQCDSS